MFEQLLARLDRVTPEEVGDVHFLDVVYPHPAVRQLDESRHASHVDRVGLEQAENFAAASARRRGNRQQHFLHAGFVDHLLDMLGLVDAQASNDTVGYLVIVIDESDRTHRATEAQGGN